MEVSRLCPALSLAITCDLFLEGEINLEPNQPALSNSPPAISLDFISQNISRAAWLHLSHPKLMVFISDTELWFRAGHFGSLQLSLPCLQQHKAQGLKENAIFLAADSFLIPK